MCKEKIIKTSLGAASGEWTVYAVCTRLDNTTQTKEGGGSWPLTLCLSCFVRRILTKPYGSCTWGLPINGDQSGGKLCVCVNSYICTYGSSNHARLYDTYVKHWLCFFAKQRQGKQIKMKLQERKEVGGSGTVSSACFIFIGKPPFLSPRTVMWSRFSPVLFPINIYTSTLNSSKKIIHLVILTFLYTNFKSFVTQGSRF